MTLTSWSQVLALLTKAQVSLEPSARLIQDSRKVTPGDVFIAIKGLQQDGAQYINKALRSGASAVLVSSLCDSSLYQTADNIIVIENLEASLADLSKGFYLSGIPQPIPLIGITGTNGKTSISHLLAQLSQLCLQSPGAVIGTMGNGNINELEETSNTTPGVTDVYRLVKDFSQQGFSSVAMEVSSHALEQGRIKGLNIDVAIFTNLTLDHLDYHGSMANYFAAKQKLFTDYQAKYNVINLDDEYGRQLASMVSQQARVIAYGFSEAVKAYDDYVFIRDFQCHSYGLSIDLEWQVSGVKENGSMQLPIYGEFNCLNLAAVFATSLALGWPVVLTHFSQLTAVPGRLELYVKPEKPIAVVDYAHTPDALEQSLKAVRRHLSGELYVVFGCGGDRDASKRSLMGKIAADLADHIIVTNDNPRTESPEQIAIQIEQGLGEKPFKRILNRQQAIEMALTEANSNDAILIAGKGHETYQVIGKEIIQYDERQFVADALTKLELHHD